MSEDVTFLKDNNFFVPEKSQSSSENSLEQGILNEETTIDEVVWSIIKKKCANKSKDGLDIYPNILKHLPKLATKFLSNTYEIVLNSGR